jgi:hypothetical protein
VAQKLFTVDEANALLASVRPLVERLVEHRRDLGLALDRREGLTEITGANGGGFNPRLPAELDAEVESAAEGISHCVQELTALGVLVKDLDTGLVDFPALRDGEEVLLCWQPGEDEIGWWHTLEGGFAGRQPL